MIEKPPNPWLQRTRAALPLQAVRTEVSSPGGFMRSPLSRQPLGVSLKSVGLVGLAVLGAAATSCHSSGLQSYCCPQPQDKVRICVRRLLQNPESPGLTTGIPATVIFRDVDKRVLFRGKTNDAGKIDLEIDYRALRHGQNVEAAAIWRSARLMAVEPLRPGVQKYKLVVTAGGAPPEAFVTDIDQCE